MDKKNIPGKRCFTVLIFTLTSFSVFAATELETKKQKLSYAMGTFFALSVAHIELDVPAFIQAVEDVLTRSEPEISMEEMQNIVEKYREEYTENRKDTMEKNKKAGETFLAKNKKKEGVIESPTGLQYRIIEEGDGEKPAVQDSVTIHYEGRLIDGTVFDSSYDRGEPVTLSLAQVIKGWQEAVTMMKTGSKWQVFIPSELAYGQKSQGKIIGSNSVLIFDIELISIK